MSHDNLLPAVRSFLSSPKQLLIDGEWVDAKDGQTFDTVNPATGFPWATGPRNLAEPQNSVLPAWDAIMGGLAMTFAYGQVRGTFDYMRERRRTYDAELRAARAEGVAEGVAAAPRTVVTDVDGDGVAAVRPKRRWF